jgi:Glycosyltransferase
MKVAIFLPSGNLGGAEQVLLQIANYHAIRGNNVDVYVLTNLGLDELKRRLNSNVMLMNANARRESVGVVRLLLSFFGRKRKSQYDRIYTSHVHLNAFVSLLRKFSLIIAKKHIARESTLIFNRFKGFRLKMFSLLYDAGYGKIDLIICQTKLMKEQLLNNKPKIGGSRLAILNNPITPLDSSYNFSNFLPDKKYIVSAGRLIPEKGFDILLESFYNLKSIHPELELVILGDGSSRSLIEAKIDNLGLRGDVHLVGHVNDVYSYFKFAKCCVVSSRIEGFPNVLLQMMMVNDSVISTLCAAGINEINGVETCPINDVEALARAIDGVLCGENSQNRSIFDRYLHNNNIESYIEKMESHLG